LKGTLEQYRSELGLRMKALHDMTYVRLPGWEEEEEDEVEDEEEDEDQEGEPGASLSEASANLTAHLQARMWGEFEKIPECWQQNEDLLERLLRFPDPTPALQPTAHETLKQHPKRRPKQRPSSSSSSSSSTPAPTTSSYNDAHQLFTHLYRDWTDDGLDLRRMTYTPILRAIARLFPPPPPPSPRSAADTGGVVEGKRILVPGAGLGRLAFELAFGGLSHQQQQQHRWEQQCFHVTAMEISPVMVAVTAAVLDVVLGLASRKEEDEGEEEEEEGRDGGKDSTNVFYPFLHDPLLNQRSHARRFHAVSFPDAAAVNQVRSHRSQTQRKREQQSSSSSPSSSPSFPPPSSLSLELGNFLHLPLHPSSSTWPQSQHAIITCFFLDTTPNPLAYLRTIHSLLQEGGYWINLGPLNYHTTLPKGAVQLTVEEIEIAAEWMGLRKVKEEEGEEEGLEGCAYRPEPPRVGGREGEGEGGREGGSAFLRVDVYQPVMGVYQKMTIKK